MRVNVPFPPLFVSVSVFFLVFYVRFLCFNNCFLVFFFGALSVINANKLYKFVKEVLF